LGHRIKEAIAAAKAHNPDAFLAVGGGSVIDTAKLMNLYTTFPGTFTLLLRLPSTQPAL
jgi:alcohol dehydrogenase class IV